MKKTKKSRFSRFSQTFLIVSLMAFAIGSVAMNSYESALNIEAHKIEKEIVSIESDIDGLTLKKQQLASFTRLESVAQAKGYTYKQNTGTAAVIGVPRN